MKNWFDPARATDKQPPEAAAPAPLELPVDRDFNSTPAAVELHAMLRRIEQHLAWRNSRPGETERRLAEKISVEFVL